MKNRVGGVAIEQLRAIIQRIEKLKEEQLAISADIRDVFAEAKGNGFDVKAIRKIIKLRSMDAAKAEEEELVLDTYRRALGMIPQLDMFEEQQKENDDDEIIQENHSAAQSRFEAEVAAYT